VLGIPANRVVVKVKRVGGGFGGKESRCMMVAVPAAIAAIKYVVKFKVEIFNYDYKEST